ncbi:sulfatase [Pelagicoccus enzymogenes]|uniref:sulfatase n=1 Tax=Pelagicoccus enzymogenes TaxID=2773457 RepID=UPI00280DB0DF|nr:sulfatase [Pelagicoccus enzymogenes]MDQ8199436.1 sulfatase [Pelagicoccus enzymogenes]
MRIIYIDIDSCRPDHLGCYGYDRETSPNIDRIAAEGVVFENCYCSDAPCMPSRTAFYSGRLGIQTGVVGHGGTAAYPKGEGATRGFRDRFEEDGLAGRLQSIGLRTAMISPFGQRHAAHWFYAGFNEVYNTGGGGEESAEEIWPVLDDWIDRNGASEDWYLHVNFWDPHTPYRVPVGVANTYEDNPLPAWLEDPQALEKHRSMVGPHGANELNMYDDEVREGFPRSLGKIETSEDLKSVIDNYDLGIRHVDQYIGKLVEKLRSLGIYEEVAIIISADHGENLGELGIYSEHATADEATCHIPMIVKWPSGNRGVDKRLCYGIDMSATFLGLLGIERPKSWDGVSMADAVVDAHNRNAERRELVVSQCAHVCQRSVRWDTWLYIRTYHDGFHLFPEEMLFDLENDPHEQEDLSSIQIERCREGAWRLAQWHAGQMGTMARRGGDLVDPLWSVIAEGGPFHARLRSPGRPGREGFLAFLRRLEASGREDGARVLREKYREELEKWA